MDWIGESLESVDSVEAGDGENVEGFAVVGLILFHLDIRNFPSNRACFFITCQSVRRNHASK